MKREDFFIHIQADPEARLLTVSDNGVGMDESDLENNLGVIASSGTLQFRQEMEKAEAADMDVIGQFGVGFYSAFMVADQVTVISRAYGADTAWKWESSGADGYTMTECEKEMVGTDVILHIKANTEDEDYDQYLQTGHSPRPRYWP